MIALSFRTAPLKKAKEQRRKEQQEAAAEGFRQLLKDTESITSASRWAKVRNNYKNQFKRKYKHIPTGKEEN